MKWFKHDCDALKDEKIQQLIIEFGPLGYMIYFGFCELVGEKIDEKMVPTIILPWPYVELLFHCKRSTVERALLAGATAEIWRFRTLSLQNGKFVEVTIPNMLKRLDNWTNRSVVATETTTEKLCRNYGIEQEVEQEVEKDIYILPKKILKHLNEKTKKNFKPVESNLKFIRARISEGYTEDALKKVIDLKCGQWLKTEMDKYLRPETLFNATKFQGYLAERESDDERDKRIIAEIRA